MRNVAPAATFFQITVGDGQVVYLANTDRVSKWRADQELEYWQDLFGDLATLRTIDGGEDIVVGQMVAAILTLSKDASGVTKAQIEGMGFAADVVARRWHDAMARIAAMLSLEAAARDALPENVIRLRPRPRLVSAAQQEPAS